MGGQTFAKAPGGSLQIAGQDGNDTITVGYQASLGGFVVADPGGVIASEGCFQVDPFVARCNVTQSVAWVDLRGGDDFFSDAGLSCIADSFSTFLNWIVVGGSGNDAICSGRGSMLALGGPGNDLIIANGRGAQVFAPPYWYNDLRGEDGNDEIRGFDDTFGNDAINGGPGVDTVRGGRGSDLIGSKDGVVDAVGDCGAGSDAAVVDPGDPVQNCESIVF